MTKKCWNRLRYCYNRPLADRGCLQNRFLGAGKLLEKLSPLHAHLTAEWDQQHTASLSVFIKQLTLPWGCATMDGGLLGGCTVFPLLARCLEVTSVW